MTTKQKIILGFSLMILFLAAVAGFAFTKLSETTISFIEYSAEARTAVNSNTADTAIREGKDKLTNFVLTLQPSYVEDAAKDLEEAITYINDTIKDEVSSTKQAQLRDSIASLKKIEDLAKTIKDHLLAADKLMHERMLQIGTDINNTLTKINGIAAQTNNVPLLGIIDDLYSMYADLNSTVRVYNATYLPENGTEAFRMMKALQASLAKISRDSDNPALNEAESALFKAAKEYADGFKEIDARIKAANEARKSLLGIATNLSAFFDEYTDTTQQHMLSLGRTLRASNAAAQSLTATGGAIGIVVGSLIALWIISGVIRALSQVSRFAEDISKGNFQAQLNLKEGGEIGTMVHSIMAIPTTLNAMAAEFSHIEQRIEAGHLGIQGDTSKFSGDFAHLVQGTNSILQRMGLILNAIPTPVVMLSSELSATYLNRAAQDIAGSDYLNRSCSQLFAREDYGTSSCALTAAAKDKNTHTSETVAHPRGRRMDIQYTSVPMLNEKNSITSVLQVIVDLTKIKETERTILDVATQALASTERVAAASEQLSAQVEQVSRGADMQRTRVESTATAMNEMNATVLEVARNAGNASEQTETTRTKANDGAALVNKVVASINGVNTVALGLQDNMKELGQQAESIGGVMNVISDIADQTNLLALNAAIEAARAGEAGRGFAVVADEVRKLAEKTMSATQEVGSNIQAIQNSARANISEVTNAVRNINEATDLANASGQALNEIVRLATDNSAVVSSIATAAEEQSATSEEINHSLEEVSRIVMETADGMMQASAAVQDLSRTAQDLKRIMERLQ